MFDPYRKWLGIPPRDQPPNHYRLLGIEQFETDLDVIEGAADKQMGFVRQYQSGEHATDAARILNELAIARLCLLKPATKAAYDEKLRQQLAPPEPAPEPEFPEGSLSFSDDAQPIKPRKAKGKSKPSKSALSPQWLMLGGGILVLVVFLFTRGGRQPAPQDSAKESIAAITATKPDVRPIVEATSTTPTTPASTNKSPVDSILWKDSKLVTEPAGAPVDLLKLVDAERDTAVGKWRQTGTTLISDRNSGIYLPAKLPEDYQLKFTARRTEGTDTLGIGFMMEGRQGVMVIDAHGIPVSGLYVDGREPKDNCTTRRGGLFQGTSLGTIVLTIHPGHFHATFDGNLIIEWFGQSDRMFLHSHWQLGSRECAFIGSVNAKYVIESATMIPIQPEPVLKRVARLDHSVDLIPLMDLERDVQTGIWAISKNTLLAPDGWGKIYIPTVVPEEYTLSTTVELPAGHQGEYGIGIGLVADKSYFQFQSAQSDLGLEVIDGRRFWQNATRLAPVLKPGVPARIDCTVTKSGVRAEVDGRTVMDWQGDFGRLSLPGDWALPDARRLFLGVMRHVKFRDIKIGPPLLAPKLPDHPPVSAGKSLDLLTLVDPVRDAYGGKWERDGTAIRCQGDAEFNKLAIPFNVPAEYKLTMRVTRLDGGRTNNEGLYVGLPIGTTKAHLTVDGVRSSLSGLHLDDRESGANSTARRGGPIIPAGNAHDIVIIALKTGLKMTVDGTLVIDWTGNPDRFSADLPWVTPGRHLTVGSWSQAFRFDKVDLEPLPPTGVSTAPVLGADGNLQAVLDAARDSQRGDWKLDGEGLWTPTYQGSRFRLPVVPPERYVLSASVERRQPGGLDIFFGLAVGGHPCAVAIDGGNGFEAGLERLDDKRFNDSINLTHRNYRMSVLTQGKAVNVKCFVLPDTIIVTCDDNEIVRWHGDPRRLSLEPTYLPPNGLQMDRNQLWLGSFGTAFLVRDLQLRPMSAELAAEITSSFQGVFPLTPQLNMLLARSRISPIAANGSKSPPDWTSAQSINLLPVPMRDEIEAARTKTLKTFANEYKDAKTNELKLQLAARLLERAANSQESTADRYAFFVEARDIQLQIGDVPAAFRVVDAMAKTFRLARFEEQADMVQRLAKKARNAAQHRHVAVIYWKLAADASAEEDYATAKDVCQRAVPASRSSGDSDLQTRATGQLRYYEGLLADWKAAKDAEQTLKQQPNDAAANAAVGAYRCWVRRDWVKGLPSLRHSPDSKLAQIVTADIANTTVAAEQRALANLWLAYAKGQKNPVIRESAAARAADWFEKAIPALSDAVKPDARQQMENACEVACRHDFKRLLSQPTNGVDVAVIVDCQSKVYPLKLKSTFDIKKSWLLSLEFNPPNLDSGLHQIFYWGDAAKGENPIRIAISENLLLATIENVVEHRGQTIEFLPPANAIGQWTELKLAYDGIGESLELYINHRLIRRETLQATPLADRDMPLFLGGDGTDGSRFTGQIQKLWLSNIP